jgi:hypothetical protein
MSSGKNAGKNTGADAGRTAAVAEIAEFKRKNPNLA